MFAIIELIIFVGIFGPPIGMGIFVTLHLLMAWVAFRKPKKQPEKTQENYEEENKLDDEDDEEQEEEEEVVEEFPFCQIFRLGGDKDLHIIRVEYCPDETAFIRVVSNDSYTKPYKRKVQRDKRGERFILFNNERFYLDPNKTQPRMPE